MTTCPPLCGRNGVKTQPLARPPSNALKKSSGTWKKPHSNWSTASSLRLSRPPTSVTLLMRSAPWWSLRIPPTKILTSSLRFCVPVNCWQRPALPTPSKTLSTLHCSDWSTPRKTSRQSTPEMPPKAVQPRATPSRGLITLSSVACCPRSPPWSRACRLMRPPRCWTPANCASPTCQPIRSRSTKPASAQSAASSARPVPT